MTDHKKQTIEVAKLLLMNIYKDIQTPEVIGMLLNVKHSEQKGDIKPLLKALRSVRRDINEIINELKD